MKTAAIAIYAIFASHMGIYDHAKPMSYNDWVARNSKVVTGQRPAAAGVDAFVNWSKNFPAQ